MDEGKKQNCRKRIRKEKYKVVVVVVSVDLLNFRTNP